MSKNHWKGIEGNVGNNPRKKSWNKKARKVLSLFDLHDGFLRLSIMGTKLSISVDLSAKQIKIFLLEGRGKAEHNAAVIWRAKISKRGSSRFPNTTFTS